MSDRIAFESTKKQAIETARTRLLVGGSLMAAAFFVVGVRLFDLAVFNENEDLRRAASREIARPTPMARADIVDRNGVLLATSLKTASLFADPRKIADPADTAHRLIEILPDLSEEVVAARLGSGKSFVWLRRNLTPRQQFEVNRLGIPGLEFEKEERRVYPHGRLAGHIVGFTNVDNVGLSGIEKSMDAAIAGAKTPLRLSIDIRVQQILRQELAGQIEKFKAIGGGGIVLDVESGEVVAMVSLPDFDPNAAGQAGADTRFNRMTLGVYELGSVFKIFNHAIALETGVATFASRYDATKPIRVARFTISDYHPKKSWLTVPEIFQHSSNIGSAKIALDIGSDDQRKYLGHLGLLRRTSIELPEQGLPMYPARWREINTMTISFGHGIAVSPLHLTSAVAAVVNGGILRPATLVEHDAKTTDGVQVFSAQTSDRMRRLLRLVVETGTGRNADAKGYLVGGKTGTAEKQVNGSYKRNALISSFVGVYPITAPRFVVFAMLDEPKGIKESYGYATGGWTAAPVVQGVVARMAPLFGIAPLDETAPDIRHAININAQPAIGNRSDAVN
ncbi:MAG: penicillin-binding protein 2 [Rhodospirillaceae bacterium]|jgi:cell division protein FtsI (penicillin-binding protein 3)|nr:penicillin-binding protein 2 [Rhodospirillaceae bacterium]MBT5358544.1 penicillin-binding protein 2 [Rhodospirillaceae bacterium]MBT5770868.1 penicillin-binding protein 2 [Rhodospirillaceae bacterium]MBT6311467.1 penicillin-binding protein 2 [Rhodospirillaceae bacterium]MBT7364564.1 penicillin-binding protein 2 [Rhodospirillaceae bacterium]